MVNDQHNAHYNGGIQVNVRSHTLGFTVETSSCNLFPLESHIHLAFNNTGKLSLKSNSVIQFFSKSFPLMPLPHASESR